MTKKTILIDVASAGASGDMFLSALIDLMSDDDALVPLAASLLIFDPTIRVKVLPRESGDQKGRQLEVTVDESVRFTPTSLREMLGAVCEEVEASKAARTLANNILETLFKAGSIIKRRRWFFFLSATVRSKKAAFRQFMNRSFMAPMRPRPCISTTNR